MQAFPPLDVEQIAGELRLKVRGKENGNLNQPASDSNIEDSTEGDILSEIERRQRKAEEDYRSQLNLYEGRIHRVLISANVVTSIEAAGQNALADLKVQATDDFNQLYNAGQEVTAREREFEAFRTANNLVRFPNLISTGEWWFRVLLLVFLVVVETILNGTFFAKGSESGLIGGVTEALVLTLINVGIAVLYGRYGFSLVVHTHPVLKAIGVFITLLYIVMAIGINLLIGHFRDMFIENQLTQESVQALTSHLISQFLTAPYFLPAKVDSLILSALGFLLSLVSAIDAAGIHDSYPGYEAVGKRRADAISVYADRNAQCLAGLTERRNSAIEEMSRVIEMIRDNNYELRLAEQGRARLHDAYRAFYKHLSDSYIRLLKLYWEANRTARSTPSPERFQKQPSIPSFLTEPPQLESLNLEEDQSALGIERMQYYIKAVNQQFEETVQKYQTVVSLTHKEDIQHVHA
jgi:hypothetical protein